jgi:hypothetical protein
MGIFFRWKVTKRIPEEESCDKQAWWRENVEAFVHLRAARSRHKNPITPQYGGENQNIPPVRQKVNLPVSGASVVCCYV